MASRNLTFAALLSVASMAAQSTAPVSEWVRDSAIRLTTPEARHGFADMAPLKKVVGDGRIVSFDGAAEYRDPEVALSLKLSADEAFKALAANPDAKVAQRSGEGMTDYKIRAGTLQQRTIGGLPALSCVADFTTGGQPLAEYLVWIRGEKATALFFGRAAAGEFDAFRERFDRVIETAKIP